MKSNLLLTMVCAVVMGPAFAETNPVSNLTFNGEVADTSCTLSTQSRNISVTLPDLQMKELQAAANHDYLVTSPKVNIEFINCPASVTTITMDSSSSTGSPYNSVPENGTGRGIYMTMNADNSSKGLISSIKMDGTAPTNNVYDVVNNTLTIPVYAKLFRHVVTPETGNYSTTFTMNFSWS